MSTQTTTKKISLVDLKNDNEETQVSSEQQGLNDLAHIKKTMDAIDWKLWEIYQVSLKFKEYFDLK
jgi:hypothetical protein